MNDALLPKGITMEKVAEAADLMKKVNNNADLGAYSNGAKKAVSYTHLTLPTICSV